MIFFYRLSHQLAADRSTQLSFKQHRLHPPTHASFESLKHSQVKVVGNHLVPSLIGVQVVSAVIYRIQLRRHIRIR